MRNELPPVYMSVEDDTFLETHGLSKKGPEKIDVEMSIEKENVLAIDLQEKLGTTPRLGDASDIVGIRVSLRDKGVFVDAFYPDPMKNVLRDYCCGSGCCCTAHICHCHRL